MAGAVRFDKDQSGPSLPDPAPPLLRRLDPGHGEGAASKTAAATIASFLMIEFLRFALTRVFGIRHVAAVALKEQHLIGIGARAFHAG